MATTIVVSPLGRQPESTGEVIDLNIMVTDQDRAGYNRMEVWRSRVGPGGPYEELTAMESLPARFPREAPGLPLASFSGPSAMLSGKTLEFLVNARDEVLVTFTGIDPLTFGAAALQINAQGRHLVTAYVTSTGKLVVQTTAVGLGASLLVLPGDGASLLGLSDQPSQGRDAWLNLVEGQALYLFEDPFGSAGYYYKMRFRNDVTNVVSEFSLPHSVGTRVGLPTLHLITGIAQLVHADGRPLINQEVHLHFEFTGTLIEGAVVAGTDNSKLTDIDGNVQFVLLRGQKLTVSVPGTSLYRSITVPVDPLRQTFNLFDPDISDGNDVFKVQVPKIVVAERRSL